MRFCDFLSTRSSCNTNMLLSGFRDSALRVTETRTRKGGWFTQAVGDGQLCYLYFIAII